jgi:hypothetical protein
MALLSLIIDLHRHRSVRSVISISSCNHQCSKKMTQFTSQKKNRGSIRQTFLQKINPAYTRRCRSRLAHAVYLRNVRWMDKELELNPGRSRRYSPLHPEEAWHPLSFLFKGTRRSFPRDRAAGFRRHRSPPF